MAYLLMGLAAAIALVAVLLALMATISLHRTKQLSAGQKIAQAILVWLVPFVGALLVLHLLAESDPDALRRRWTPNDTINDYVYLALSVEVRIATRAVEQQVENEIFESLSHSDHSASGDVGGGDGH